MELFAILHCTAESFKLSLRNYYYVSYDLCMIFIFEFFTVLIIIIGKKMHGDKDFDTMKSMTDQVPQRCMTDQVPQRLYQEIDV